MPSVGSSSTSLSRIYQGATNVHTSTFKEPATTEMYVRVIVLYKKQQAGDAW